MKTELDIYKVIRDFHRISGMRVSIHDTERNEIYAYPDTPLPFCRRLQENPAVRADCLKNDAYAFDRVKKQGTVYVYRCGRGLYEAVAPIYHYGVLSGYLMMGQLRDDKPEALAQLRQSAAAFLHSAEECVLLAGGVPAVGSAQLEAYINIITVVAEYLTGYNMLHTVHEQLPQRILKYLNQNYANKITIGQLQHRFGCCAATLTGAFKREYNISIMTYLNGLRLEKAAEMLKRTRKPVKEIAAECGFYDQNYFSRLFSQRFSCPPKEYRTR